MTEFIFFMTYSDVTIYNALDVFENIKETGIEYVGFKDVGLPKDKLKKLKKKIDDAGLTSVLEVVSATEEDNIRSIKMGVELGVDYIIGGTYVEQSLPLLKDSNVKYFPYVGEIVGHPCLLRGSVEYMIQDAKRVEELGVDGIDLLAYRYDGDVEKLIASVQKSVDIPLIIAGSVNSFERIQNLLDLNVWGFTIGTAIFDKEFVPNADYSIQIKAVLEKLK